MKIKLPLLLVTPLLALGTARADILSTGFDGAASQSGIMFDVVGTAPLRLEALQFAPLTSTVSGNVEIYTKAGTHVGFAANPGAWTSLGIYPYPAGAAGAARPPVTLNTPIVLAAGERRAFYIRDLAVDLRHAAGDGTGTLEAADQNLVLLEGTAVSGTFTSAFIGRIPNVALHYETDFLPPTVTVVGPRTTRTSSTRATIFGLAQDDTQVATVRAKYRRATAKGLGPRVTKNIVPAASGLFRLNLRLAPGRNAVTFQAIDGEGRTSPVTRATVIRR